MSLDRERGMWECPTCRRRVPARVLECRCGAFKAQATVLAGRESGSRSSLLGGVKLTLGLAASVAVCVAWVRYVWPVWEGPGKAPVGAVAPAPPAARAVPVAAPPPPQRETRPSWSAAPPPWPVARVETLGDGSAAPDTPTAAREVGAVAPPPSTLSEPDQARQRGLRQLEAEFRGMAGAARELIALVERYEGSCTDVPTPGCNAQLSQIGHLAIAVGAGIERTEDIARTSWLDPGVVRDLRVKYGLEDGVWDDIERLTREYRR